VAAVIDTVRDNALYSPSGGPITMRFESERRGASFGWSSNGMNGVTVKAFRNGSLVHERSFAGSAIVGFPGYFQGTATVPGGFDTLVVNDLGGPIGFVIDAVKAEAR
jgi:hypothetical protein